MILNIFIVSVELILKNILYQISLVNDNVIILFIKTFDAITILFLFVNTKSLLSLARRRPFYDDISDLMGFV